MNEECDGCGDQLELTVYEFTRNIERAVVDLPEVMSSEPVKTFCGKCGVSAAMPLFGKLGLTPMPTHDPHFPVLCCRCHGHLVGANSVAAVVYTVEKNDYNLGQTLCEYARAPICALCETKERLAASVDNFPAGGLVSAAAFLSSMRTRT